MKRLWTHELALSVPLFASPSSCSDLLTDKDLIVKLEIGSGSGEWIVEQAISDFLKQKKSSGKQKVLWVSLEQVSRLVTIIIIITMIVIHFSFFNNL